MTCPLAGTVLIGPAADALVDSLFMEIMILPGKSGFGPLLPGDTELFISEDLPPLLIRPHHFFHVGNLICPDIKDKYHRVTKLLL